MGRMNSLWQQERRRERASFQSGLEGLLVFSARQWAEESTPGKDSPREFFPASSAGEAHFLGAHQAAVPGVDS